MVLSQHLTNKGTFNVRRAKSNDAHELSVLNAKWHFHDLANNNLTNGFLQGQPYSAEEFELIIKNNEIVLADINNRIAGYYLFDNITKNPTSMEYEKRITLLVEKKLITEFPISRRAQAVIDDEFQGNGLYKHLFTTLNNLCKEKYMTVFSMAHKRNPKIAANFTIGWKIINEDENFYNVYYNIN